MNSRDRIIVLGVGNELLKDEGVGVHVARALARENLPASVEIIEAGTVTDCLPGNEPVNKLVVIDAVCGGCKPGAVYRFTLGEMPLQAECVTSVHQLDIMDSLRLDELCGIRPDETVIIGIEPKEIGWGMELSAEIEQKIPDAVRAVLKEINHVNNSVVHRAPVE